MTKIEEKDNPPETEPEGLPTEEEQENSIEASENNNGEGQGNSDQLNPLPDGFTKGPKDPGHADLNNFSDPQIRQFIDIYKPVSDDAGELLGNTALEIKVVDVIDRLKAVDLKNKDAALAIVAEAQQTAKEYQSGIHLATSIVSGTLTKYRLREGKLCNALKPVVKAAGENFTDWIGNTYSPKRLRSLEVFMSLDRIPGIIKYSFLDIERLKKIRTAIKGYDPQDQDPVGTYFRNNDITLDFDSDEGMEDFKADLDTAIAVTAINKALVKDSLEATVDKTLVKNVVGVCKIGTGKVSNIVSTVRREEDLDKYLKELHQNKGRVKKVVTENITIEGFPRIVSELKSTVEFITANPDLAEEITEEHVADLERQIAALRSLISPQNVNNQ